MIHRSKRRLAVLLTLSMLMTCLPFGLTVNADMQRVLYFCADPEAMEEYELTGSEGLPPIELEEEIPDGYTRLGVYAENATDFAAWDSDRIIIANNTTIVAPTADIMSEDCYIGVAGSGTVSTGTVDVCNAEGILFEDEPSFETIWNFFFEENNRPVYQYTFTGDYVVQGELDASSIYVNEGAVLTIAANEDYFGNVAGSRTRAYDYCINGELKVDATLNGQCGPNIVEVVDNGYLMVGEEGILTGGTGAALEFPDGGHVEVGILVCDSSGFAVDEPDPGMYVYSDDAWIQSPACLVNGFYRLSYDQLRDWGNEDEGFPPQAFVYPAYSYDELADGGYYTFEPNVEITLDLYPPEWLRDEMPSVIITNDNDLYDEADIELVEDGLYRATYTPQSADGFELFVDWHDFGDPILEEDQIMLELDRGGSAYYSVNIEGEEFIDPRNDDHKKIVYDSSVLANGLEVTFGAHPDHFISAINYQEAWYSLEEALELDAFSVVSEENGVYKVTFTEEDFGEDGKTWFTVEADDAHKDPGPAGEDGCYQVSYVKQTSWNEQTGESVLTGFILIDGEFVDNDMQMIPFEEGQELEFTLVSPTDRRQDNCVPVVRIDKGESSISSRDGDIELTRDEDEYIWTFTYTPDSSEYFHVDIDWSDYDEFEAMWGDLMVNINGLGGCNITTNPSPSGRMTDPYYANTEKILFNVDNRPDDGIVLTLTPSSGTVIDAIQLYSIDAEDGIDGNYLTEGSECDYLSDPQPLSDCSWLSEDNGVVTITIPGDYGTEGEGRREDRQINISICGVGSYVPPTPSTSFVVNYESRWNWDPDTMERIPSVYVEYDGEIIDSGVSRGFTIGEELEFTLVPPEERIAAGADPVVYVSVGNNRTELDVVDNTFSYTPTTSEFVIFEVYWSEYDAIRAGENQFIVLTEAYGRGENGEGGGSIAVEQALSFTNEPGNIDQKKWLVSSDSLSDGATVDVSFTPYETYDLTGVFIDLGPEIDDGYLDFNVEEMEESEDFYLDEDGIWHYLIREVPANYNRQMRISANFSSNQPETMVGTLMMSDLHGIQAEYAFDYGEGAGEFTAIAEGEDNRIEINPEDPTGGPERILVKFTATDGQDLSWVRFANNYLCWVNASLARLPDDHILVLEKGMGWGHVIVSFYGDDNNYVGNNEYRFELVGSDSFNPLIQDGDGYEMLTNYIYSYDGRAAVNFYIPETVPAYVVVYALNEPSLVLERCEGGIYSYSPANAGGFVVKIFEREEDYNPDAEVFNITVGECEHGSIDVPATAGLDTEVMFTITPDEGYEVESVTVTGVEGWQVEVADNMFRMPPQDVVIDVVFREVLQPVQSGWVSEDGKWYYYNEEGEKQTGWLKDGSVYYYLDPANDGAMAKGWVKVGKYYYFMNNSGIMQTGWLQRGSTWYYLDPTSGAMATSWKKISGKWYFFDRDSGAMMTGGWKKIDTVWYYFNDSGEIATGWKKIEGVYYYFDADGIMQKGWIKDNNKWYYLDSSGAMYSSRWIDDHGKWYYVDSNGAMVAGRTMEINGINYRFAANGVCENPDGDPTDGWVKVNGVYHYFVDGVSVTGWFKDGGKWYYLDPDNDGAMYKGWLTDGNYTYFLGADGAMYASRTATIDGVEYTFDAAGHRK